MPTPRNRESRLWRFRTKISVEQGNPVLFVEGRLGHAAAGELETEAVKLFTAENATIDLSGVDYLSSAALKVFQAIGDRQSQKGGRLHLRAPSAPVRLSLELSGLSGFADLKPQCE